MMSLDALPSELLHTILSHLDIPSLLAFSRTSSTNYTHHLYTLSTLHLAVFPKKVQSLIAFLQHSESAADLHNPQHHVSITLPQRPGKRTNPKSYRNSVIASQNQHLTALVSRYARSLETLSFHAWDLLPSAATALAEKSSRLRHLSLCFDHAACRDPCLPSGYFDEPTKASPLWNAPAGLGDRYDEKLVLRNLVSLRLERAGCTSAQLRSFVSRNPGLRELRLRKVRGVDEEFVNWLGSEANPCCGSLAVLSIEECADLELNRTEQYAWLTKLSGLTSLRISGCRRVDERTLKSVNESLKIRQIGGYWDEKETLKPNGGVIQVDESCL